MAATGYNDPINYNFAMSYNGLGGGPCGADFDVPNSRVQLTYSPLPILPGLGVYVERDAGSSGWVGVRGGFPYPIGGATLSLDDYEFVPNVLNSYRIRTDFVYDTFTRVLANSWGNADSGQAWTYTASAGSTINNWDIPAGKGIYTMADAVSAQPRMGLTTVSVLDFDFYMDGSLSQTPTGGMIAQVLTGRRGGTSIAILNMYYTTAGNLDIALYGNNGATQLASVSSALGGIINTTFHVRFQAKGLTLRAKVWTGDAILDEPSVWTISAQDIVPPVAGSISVEGVRLSGNTNVNPLMTWDNLHVGDLATTNTQYKFLCQDNLIPEQDQPWLKFPLRPFLNRPITLCNWGDEERPARGQIFEVLGRRLPVAITEVRGSRRFPVIIKALDSDENDALALSMSFGDVIFLQTPGPTVVCDLNMRIYPEQGYFYADDETNARPIDGVTTWVMTLGLQEVAAPDFSVAGANSTWGGIIAAFATWQDVINTFATWTDVLNYISNPLDEVVG